MEILRSIRMWREVRGWTQEQMAERLNVSINTYARVERGESALSWQRLEEILAVLEIDLKNLITPPRDWFF